MYDVVQNNTIQLHPGPHLFLNILSGASSTPSKGHHVSTYVGSSVRVNKLMVYRVVHQVYGVVSPDSVEIGNIFLKRNSSIFS